MSEETIVKKEEAVPAKMSGTNPPSSVDIAENIKDYSFDIEEIRVSPRIKVYKDGKLVRVFSDIVQEKLMGTMNPEYAKQFMLDIVNDFKIAWPQAIKQQQIQSENKSK